MRKSSSTKRFISWFTLLLVGGSSFQLGGCDQEIRTGILGGLNSATDTLLVSLTAALFTALDNAGQDDDLTGGGLTGGTTTGETGN